MYIAVLRSGIENVNQKLCEERGIKIINALERSAYAVADCTVGIMHAEIKNIVHDSFVPDEILKNQGYTTVDLDELLQQSDLVSIHLRLSDKTEKYIGSRELGLMKKAAYFINCARAGLVDEKALIKVLENIKRKQPVFKIG